VEWTTEAKIALEDKYIKMKLKRFNDKFDPAESPWITGEAPFNPA
jgi:hypothetical protein